MDVTAVENRPESPAKRDSLAEDLQDAGAGGMPRLWLRRNGCSLQWPTMYRAVAEREQAWESVLLLVDLRL